VVKPALFSRICTCFQQEILLILFAKSNSMKKFILTPVFSLTMVLFVLTSCGKEEDNTPAPKTKTELITTGSWQFDKAISGGFDVSGSVPACYKDNVVTFTATLNGSIVNTVVCTPTDPTPATFTWSWQTSETILALNAPLFPGGSGNFNLISLTATALVVEQTVNFGGTPTSVTFHYKH
jgi:hypothetical protein